MYVFPESCLIIRRGARRAKCLEETRCLAGKWSNSPTCRQNGDPWKEKTKNWLSQLFCGFFFCRLRCTLVYPSRTSTPPARQIPPAPCARDSPATLNQSHCSPPACPFDLLTLFTPNPRQRPQREASHAFITPADLDLWTICMVVSQAPCFQSWEQILMIEWIHETKIFRWEFRKYGPLSELLWQPRTCLYMLAQRSLAQCENWKSPADLLA